MGRQMITVVFNCQHSMQLDDKATASPICGICGERTVRRVTTSRPPRFVGACTGPYAEYKGLEPGIVDVAPKGPLHLKDQE